MKVEAGQQWKAESWWDLQTVLAVAIIANGDRLAWISFGCGTWVIKVEKMAKWTLIKGADDEN